MDETFGQRLARFMGARGVRSAAELGRETGLGRQYVSQLLKDERKPGHKTLTTLADYFGTSVDQLTGRATAAPVDAVTALAVKLAALAPDDRAAVEAMIDRLTPRAAPIPPRRRYQERKPGTGPLRIVGGPEGTRQDAVEDTNPDREAL